MPSTATQDVSSPLVQGERPARPALTEAFQAQVTAPTTRQTIRRPLNRLIGSWVPFKSTKALSRLMLVLGLSAGKDGKWYQALVANKEVRNTLSYSECFVKFLPGEGNLRA